MQFNRHRRRGAPTVIIVSLIDVLIVVLIFLMVTTTFKQQAALKLALPESSEEKQGATLERAAIVSIDKRGVLYFQSATDGGANIAVPYERLEELLKQEEARNPKLVLTINADTDAPWGRVVKVRDAAKAAHIKSVNGSVKSVGAQ